MKLPHTVPELVFSEPIRHAIYLLNQARKYAIELHLDSWDFALEIANLRNAGLTSNDLRWLVGTGYIEHAIETTHLDEKHRMFRRPRSLILNDKTCFVLSEKGLIIAGQLSTIASSKVNGNGRRPVPPVSTQVPFWNENLHELWLGNLLVKAYDRKAPLQHAILMSFQKQNWITRIADPLPSCHQDGDSAQRLHDTINRLNGAQRLPVIRFRKDGTGRGIRWELVTLNLKTLHRHRIDT